MRQTATSCAPNETRRIKLLAYSTNNETPTSLFTTALNLYNLPATTSTQVREKKFQNEMIFCFEFEIWILKFV
jgi:hypothetical protein